MEAERTSNTVQCLAHWRPDDIDRRCGRAQLKRCKQNDSKFTRTLREYAVDPHILQIAK